jgi:hypothetical protein
MSATTTGTIALNNALAIMDELNSTEYNARAVYFINMLCDKLYPYSDNYIVVTEGARPIVTHITALTDTLGIDDVLAQSVLPYGLASQLMLSDDASQAANFESMFQERLKEATRQVSAVVTEIEDVYGLDTSSISTF